jgi:hypothetical protein
MEEFKAAFFKLLAEKGDQVTQEEIKAVIDAHWIPAKDAQNTLRDPNQNDYLN